MERLANQLKECDRKTREGISKAALLLASLDAAITNEEIAAIEGNPFNKAESEMLREIGRSEWMHDASIVKHLPGGISDWFGYSGVGRRSISADIAKGRLHSGMTREDIEAYLAPYWAAVAVEWEKLSKARKLNDITAAHYKFAKDARVRELHDRARQELGLARLYAVLNSWTDAESEWHDQARDLISAAVSTPGSSAWPSIGEEDSVDQVQEIFDRLGIGVQVNDLVKAAYERRGLPPEWGTSEASTSDIKPPMP